MEISRSARDLGMDSPGSFHDGGVGGGRADEEAVATDQDTAENGREHSSSSRIDASVSQAGALGQSGGKGANLRPVRPRWAGRHRCSLTGVGRGEGRGRTLLPWSQGWGRD